MRTWHRSILSATLFALMSALPVKAAEKIYLTYGPLNLSLSVKSLEIFAKEDKINQNLAFYLRNTTPQEQEEFRQALLKRAEVNPVLLYRFFNTQIGEDILTRLGKLITIQGGSNGKYALRAALIQAALDPKGLSLLNFLEKLPTNMQFQGEAILELARTVEGVVKATETFIQTLKTLTEKEAASESPVDFSALPNLRQPGEFPVEKETWRLSDRSRNRQFYVKVYKPQRWRLGEKTPVIIMSHGLASRPEDFGKGAEYLASYGYVVVLPQHPGSDYRQAQALLEGYSREVFDVNEFINRPKDISYVIDELQRRNPSEFAGRLDLESVGVFGHSFGGYTALALAGAEIDFAHLEQECAKRFGILNASLLLQCRALMLPRQTYNFRDSRVKAVYVVNPVNSAIFGPEGLSQVTIPVLMASGSYDPATPAVFEQARSFLWIETPNKYLAMIEGQAHVDFSELDASITDTIESVTALTLPSPDLIANYANPLRLAFFEVYLGGNAQYRPYLDSAYAVYLSQGEAFKLALISGASSGALAEAIAPFKW